MLFDPAEHPFKESHKLMIGSIVPRPIAFVSTISKNGILNLAPFSYFNGVCSNPPTIMFAPGRRGYDGGIKDTLQNIQDTHEFVVNIVSEGFVDIKFMGVNGYQYINDNYYCMVCDDPSSCSNCDEIRVLPWVQDVPSTFNDNYSSQSDCEEAGFEWNIGEQDTSECIDCIIGDINDDSSLNILDLVSISNLILDNSYDECGDTNSDGELNILDLVILVNIILNN